ncbi:serine-type D-Ala-D-Ala carboxypeptidase OS=Streptomyces aurantiogriseus OX=66870 GN=GCM10010251_23650 PE=3 SV=1 [Streptomyces aurantiogriseus]
MVRTVPWSGSRVGGSWFDRRAVGVRHMEEASVAGESPDRSKQRESSAEPTSGSAGAVPEARDPRAAVTRGGVDTATRVFSVRELKTDGSPEDSDSAEPAGGEEPEEAAQDAAEGDEASAGREKRAGASESRDERLRAAVAQWVASADETASGETGEDSGKGSGTSRDSQEESAQDAAEETAGSAADDGADDGAEPEAGQEPAAKAEATREPKPAKTTPKWATSASAGAEAEPGPGATATQDAKGDDAEPDKADATGKREQARQPRESKDEVADKAVAAHTDDEPKADKGDAGADGSKGAADGKAGAADGPKGAPASAESARDAEGDDAAEAEAVGKAGSADKSDNSDEGGKTVTADEGGAPKAERRDQPQGRDRPTAATTRREAGANGRDREQKTGHGECLQVATAEPTRTDDTGPGPDTGPRVHVPAPQSGDHDRDPAPPTGGRSRRRGVPRESRRPPGG